MHLWCMLSWWCIRVACTYGVCCHGGVYVQHVFSVWCMLSQTQSCVSTPVRARSVRRPLIPPTSLWSWLKPPAFQAERERERHNHSNYSSASLKPGKPQKPLSCTENERAAGSLQHVFGLGALLLASLPRNRAFFFFPPFFFFFWRWMPTQSWRFSFIDR